MNNVFLFRLRRLCAFLIGVVFLLAGIFKLLDPVGAGLVMEGYFRFFHVTFLSGDDQWGLEKAGGDHHHCDDCLFHRADAVSGHIQSGKLD